MGLIERAIGADGPGEGTANLARPFTRVDGEPFEIDAARLRKLGVYAPGSIGGSQAYELRAIKRRLLRRIGFLQRAGRDPRALRNAGRQRNLAAQRPDKLQQLLAEWKKYVAANGVLEIEGLAKRPGYSNGARYYEDLAIEAATKPRSK